MTYRSLFLFFVLSLFASTAALHADAGKNVNKDAAGLAIKGNDPTAFTIFEDKLYLNYNHDVSKMFNKALENWTKLLEKEAKQPRYSGLFS